jgi:hypothetical protein
MGAICQCGNHQKRETFSVSHLPGSIGNPPVADGVRCRRIRGPAWKSHDWGALDRLYEKGYISDPKSKAKSVVLSAEALQRSRELFERHFGCGRGEISG